MCWRSRRPTRPRQRPSWRPTSATTSSCYPSARISTASSRAGNEPVQANFPSGVAYQRNVNWATQTLLGNDGVTPVPTSIDPFFFKLSLGVPKVTTVIADHGAFGECCVGSFKDEVLTINNSGTGVLRISSISSSNVEFEAPSVVSYPIKLEARRFDRRRDPLRAEVIGSQVREDPHRQQRPRLATRCGRIRHRAAPSSQPGHSQPRRVRQRLRGRLRRRAADPQQRRPLSDHRERITSSSAAFQVPEVLAFPLLISPGDSLDLPIRFAPAAVGAATRHDHSHQQRPRQSAYPAVNGTAPAGQLVVTGSLCFGGVKACCRAERTISICNMGECALHVTNVAFKRKNPHWKLINNPFPASLPPGACLGLVIRYKATEKCPIACELVITSDDPTTPVKTLDVMAYTIWDECRCERNCDKCGGRGCERCRCGGTCDGAADDCCADEDDD